MRTKGKLAIDQFPAGLSPQLVAAVQVGHLKRLYRQGWLRRGLPEQQCESVAEHSFGVAMLAMLLGNDLPDSLDHHRLLQLALLHDCGEVHAGDITPADAVLPADKAARERASTERVFQGLPHAQALVTLWEEYEAGASPEARLVRELDRLEMAIQATVYRRCEHLPVAEFLESASREIHTPALARLLAELRRMHESEKP